MTVTELDQLIRGHRNGQQRAAATNVSHRLECFSGGSEIELADDLTVESLLDGPIIMTMREDERLVIARG